MPTHLIQWQEKEFDTALKEKGMLVVEFGAPWCAACKKTEPIVAEISHDFPNIKFAKIDVSVSPALAAKMSVMSLPNIFIFVDGKVKDQIIGAASHAKIKEKIQKLVN
jgi:thioredoxin 1